MAFCCGCFEESLVWEKLSRGVSKPGGSHFFGNGPDCVADPFFRPSTVLVGAFDRPRKRKRTNRENPREKKRGKSPKIKRSPGGLHDGFWLGGSGEHPALLLLVLQNTA